MAKGRKTGGSQRRLKVVKGVVYSHCHGHTHPEGEWIALNLGNFYSRGTAKDGMPKYQSECKKCHTSRKGQDQYVMVTSQMLAWVQAIENRVGKVEAGRMLGCRRAVINSWGRTCFRMQKRTLRKIVSVLYYLQKNDIIRHRDSIRYGATLRNRKEKKVDRADRNSFYRSHGDVDTEYAREKRRRLTNPVT